ncbi:MAG TPA: hypothetical protein VEJ18_19795, partial [Planctomycetota bacterium]|nr:hypothetical protein [Planctomycetota bacterium]
HFCMSAPARLRCLCGRIHSLDRQKVMARLGCAHWRCTACGRKFVILHEPPDTFTPAYVDPYARPQEVNETGSSPVLPRVDLPLPPPAIEFKCRCGERMTAHSWMYGSTLECQGCRTPMLLVLKFNRKRNWHVIDPEYPLADSATLKTVQASVPAPSAPVARTAPAVPKAAVPVRTARIRRASSS